MSVDEVPVILDLIRAIKRDASKTVLLVEHKMDVVRELADHIIVLHNGTLMADGEPEAVIASPVVQEAYLGMAPVAGGDVSDLHGRAPCGEDEQGGASIAFPKGPTSAIPHPARRRLRGAAGRTHHAAGAQRRRQDDHAAHHHGPLARLGRPRAFEGADIAAPPPGHRRLRHRLRAGEHGHLHRPHGGRRT